MLFTRSDTRITNWLSNELNMANTTRSERVELVTKVFNELTTPAGITYVNKHANIKRLARSKLELFYSEPEVKTQVVEWHMKIFNKPLRQMEKMKAEKEAKRAANKAN